MKNFFKFIGALALIAVLIPSLFYVSLLLWGDWHDDWSGYNTTTFIGDGYCNIAVLPVQGKIHTYGTIFDDYGNEMTSTNAQDAVSFLEQAEYEAGILGVLALVDSTGGSAAAAELVTTELKRSVMPNAAYILDSGNSAAYLIASAADTIIATPYADIGSIGVTMSYLNYALQNEAQGIEYVSLSSGEFKDYGSQDKPLTEAERALLERDLDIWHDEFVNQVAQNRNLPQEAVAALADGSSMPSKLALETGLIDEVGDMDAARRWFARELSLTPEEVVFCK